MTARRIELSSPMFSREESNTILPLLISLDAADPGTQRPHQDILSKSPNTWNDNEFVPLNGRTNRIKSLIGS